MSARTLLHESGFDVARLRVLARTPNRVYRARTSDGRSFILRYRDQNALALAVARLQQRWLAAIARETDITAPRIVPLNGNPFQSDGGRQAALFTWVDGRRAAGPAAFVTPPRLHAVGLAVAKLHRHAERFHIGDMTNLRRFDADYFFSSDLSPLSMRDRAVIERLARRTRRAMKQLGDRRDRLGLIHGDLGPANWIFHRGAARPIDFEEFGVGYFVFDLMQVIWSHAAWPDYPRYRDALLAGYESVRPLDDIERRHLPLLAALPHIDWINRTLHANHRASLKRSLPATMKRLRTLAADRP